MGICQRPQDKAPKGATRCLVLLAVLALPACVSPVSVNTPLPHEEIGRIGISDVEVTFSRPPPEEFPGVLTQTLEEDVGLCAAGDLPRRLRVRVDRAQEQNVALTLLVGGGTNLSGQVQFVDPETDRVVGDYYIEVGETGSGIAGAARMSNAVPDLSVMFAEKICDEILLWAGEVDRPVSTANVDHSATQAGRGTGRSESKGSTAPVSGQAVAAARQDVAATKPISGPAADRIRLYFERKDTQIKSTLRSYNEAHRIGRGASSQSYKVRTIDSLEVLAAEDDRTTVQLGFTSGIELYPTYHEVIYNMLVKPRGPRIVAHSVTSKSSGPAKAATTGERSAVAEADRDRVLRFVRNNDNKVKSRLASYNASKRIGRTGNSTLFKVLSIDDVVVRIVDGDRATVEFGFSSGYRSFPSYHKYLYDVRLSSSDIVILGHQKL